MSAFKSLRETQVLLASPGDVGPLRKMARKIAKAINAESGLYRDLTLLAWEEKLKETVFNDAIPAQYQIVDPTDPKVLGLVAFFGERIGQPLPEGFPEGDLASAFPRIYEGVPHEGKSYKLVHPWQPGAEAEGGFPLTGTTFEVLGFLAEQQRKIALGSGKPLSAFLCFSSPASCLQQDDACSVPWGMERLKVAIEQSGLNAKEQHSLQGQRLEQLPQLLNFARFITGSGCGIVPRWEPDYDKIESALEAWYRPNFGTTRKLTEDQAFRGLRSFDVADHHCYFGRTGEVRNAVEAIEATIETPGIPNVYWIDGSSGVGKSSFLRAGIIGRLLNSPHVSDTFTHVVRRPGDLLPRAGAGVLGERAPLRRYFALCLEALQRLDPRPPLDAADAIELLRDYDRVDSTELPGWMAGKLEVLLDRFTGPKDAEVGRLVLGVDQFEEIVDMLVDPDLGKGWALFASFLAAAARCPHIFIAATMRKERIPKLEANAQVGPLWTERAGRVAHLDLPAAHSLREIIRQPFIGLGQCTLSEPLVSHLVDGVLEFKSTLQSEEIGRVMPLISLMLERLHRNVGKKKWEEQYKIETQDDAPKRTAKSALAQAADKKRGDEKPMFDPQIHIEEAQAYCGLDGAIADLGQAALDRAATDEGFRAGEDTLDKLLRRLVRWSGESDDRQYSLRIIEMPTSADEFALAKAMLSHRLLVEEGDNRVKLVHEMVLVCWPAAQAFCVRERPLQEEATFVEATAMRWNNQGRGADFLADMMKHCTPAAFDMLSLWGSRYDTSHFNSDPPELQDLVVRDFCLELMKLVNDGGCVVQRSTTKATHLHVASFYQRSDIVRAMLRAQPGCVDFQRGDERTAVIAACFHCDIDTLEAFLANNANLNIPDEKGWYAVHAAAIGGDVAFMKRLMEAGATFDIEKTPDQTHPIRFAAQEGHLDLIDHYLDDLDTDRDLADANDRTPLAWAVIGEQGAVIRHLIGRGADPERWITYPKTAHLPQQVIHIAAESGLVASLEVLLEANVNMDAPMRNGMTALHRAAMSNYPATVAFLAREGADLNARAVNIHFEAEMEVHDEIKEPSVLQKGAIGWTALHIAVEAGEIRVVEALLEAGADPNLTTGAGQTPLHLAIDEGHDDIALLLSKPTDTTLRNQFGETPLELAVRKNRLALAKDLTRNGCSAAGYVELNGFKDEHEATLLHAAAFDRDISKLRFALDTAAPETPPDAFGRSPLHYAAAAGLSDRVELLLGDGIGPVDKRDMMGRSPLEYACLSGDLDTVTKLTDAFDAERMLRAHPDLPHLTARAGSIPVIEHLMSLGYRIDTPDVAAMTPLVVAVIFDFPDLSEWLCAHGADRFLERDGDPVTSPLAQAARLGRLTILEAMLKGVAAQNVPLDALIRETLAHQQPDCTAALLEWAASYGRQAEMGLEEVEQIYSRQMARLDETLGRHAMRSDRLEALLAA